MSTFDAPPWHSVGPRWRGLSVLLVGQAMGSWGAAAMSVAAPSVAVDFALSIGQLQLIASGFSFALTTFLVAGARLGAESQWHWFRNGALILALSGLLSALAPTWWVLLIGQILAGLGAAILVPQVLSLIQLRFHGRARALAISLYSMSLGAGVVGGLLITGLLMSLLGGDLGWRAAFLLYAPIGLCLAFGSSRWLLRLAITSQPRFDRLGLVLFSLALGLLTVTLNIGSHRGWPLWSVIAGLGGLGLLGAFALYEITLRRRGRQPLLDVELLASGTTLPALYVVLATMGGYGTLIYVLSSYLQKGAGFSVFEAALVFATYALAFALVNLFWTRLPERWHRAISPVALLLLGAAQLLLVRVTGPVPQLPAMLVLLALAGIGHGAGFGALVAWLTAIVPAIRVPSLSALVNTMAQLGVFLGIAFLGGIYTAATRPDVPASHAAALTLVLPVLAGLSVLAFFCSTWVCSRRVVQG